MSQKLFDRKKKPLATPAPIKSVLSNNTDWLSALLSDTQQPFVAESKTRSHTQLNVHNRNTFFSTNNTHHLSSSSNVLIDERVNTLSKRINKMKIAIENHDDDTIKKETEKTKTISERLIAAIQDNAQAISPKQNPYSALQHALQDQLNSIDAYTRKNSQTSILLDNINQVESAIVEHHVAAISLT